MRELDRKYQTLWQEAEQALLSGQYPHDAIPRHGDARWGLSLVAVADGEVRENVATDLERLASAAGAHHFVYTPENLHVTIRSLEGFQDRVPEDQVEHYLGQAADLLREVPQISVTFEGLGGAKGGVFVCGYPDEGLRLLRERLHERGAADGPRAVATGDYARSRDTAHMSLAVFQHPATPEPRLAAFVNERRAKPYGRLTVSELALVSYTLNDGRIGMRVLAQVPTGSGRQVRWPGVS